MAKIYVEGGLFGQREGAVVRRPEEATKEEISEIGRGMAAAAKSAHERHFKSEDRFAPEYVKRFRGKNAAAGIGFICGVGGMISGDIRRRYGKVFISGFARGSKGAEEGMTSDEFDKRVEAFAEDLRHVQRNPEHYTARQDYSVEKDAEARTASVKRADGAISIELACRTVPVRHWLFLRKNVNRLLVQAEYNPVEAYGEIVSREEEEAECGKLSNVLKRHFDPDSLEFAGYHPTFGLESF